MDTNALLGEQLISLGEAARVFPGARGADRINPSTVLRWCRKGVRTATGVVRLDSLRAGSRVFTTREAVSRFVASLSSPGRRDEGESRTPTARRRAADAAAAALDAAGA